MASRFFAALCLLFCSLALAEDGSFFSPTPWIDAGFRFQTVDRGTRPDLLLAGTSLLLIKMPSGDQGAFWSFLNPGLQYQDNGELVISLSPVSFVGRSGLGAGLQIFPFGSGRNGGVFGFTVGYHWF